MLCTCPVTRDCVYIDEKEESHIKDRHFNPNLNNTQDPKQAFVYEDLFCPEQLFNGVIHDLRNGLESHAETSGTECYAIYLHFPYDVGFFPNRRYGPFSTAILRVVCFYTVCQYCFEHCPSKVHTIYPWLPDKYWT